MKRILLILTLAGLLLPLAPRAQADTEVSLDLFYDNLSPYGSWIEVADYGYCFQPSVAVGNSDWRPYSDGYWAYTDLGWTWVSYEDFGWATYHYGRWANLENFGWAWVPGYEWAPAWVSWRTGGDYVGWAPLPPQRGEVIYEGNAITSHVDIQFGIGPLYYNFVDIRYIGEPVLRGRIIPPARNVTIINNTVNVTNITYNNSVIHNYGPDYNRLNQYSTRPVQRLSIQRETTAGTNLTQGRKGNFNRVNGNQLTVVAPQIQKSQKRIAPKQVKTKVEKPTVETGWQGINNRQQVEAEMKKGDPQNIKAPDFQPQKGRKREAVAGAEQRPGVQPEQSQGSAATEAGQQGQDDRQTQPNRQQQREQSRQQRQQAEPDAADRTAQQAEAEKTREENRRNRGGQTRENAAADAGQQGAAAQPSGRAGQSEAERSARQQQAEERRAQQAAQSAPQEQVQPDRAPGADPQRDARKSQQAGENQSTPDSSSAETDRVRRGQRSERAQPGSGGDAEARGNSQTGQQQPNQAERAQRQMQERSSQQQQARLQQQQPDRSERAQRQMQERSSQQQQARPQQQQQRQQRQQGGGDSNDPQPGKKKKPAQEPSPRP